MVLKPELKLLDVAAGAKTFRCLDPEPEIWVPGPQPCWKPFHSLLLCTKRLLPFMITAATSDEDQSIRDFSEAITNHVAYCCFFCMNDGIVNFFQIILMGFLSQWLKQLWSETSKRAVYFDSHTRRLHSTFRALIGIFRYLRSECFSKMMRLTIIHPGKIDSFYQSLHTLVGRAK